MEELLKYPGVVSTVGKLQVSTTGVLSTVETVLLKDVGSASTVETVRQRYPGIGIEEAEEGTFILIINN